MIRQATLDDIPNIKQLADRHKKELGFILRPALVEAVDRAELLYHPESGSFCHYHRRRDGFTTLREICVTEAYRGQGIGRELIDNLCRPVRLKCPVTNSSNDFYRHLGFQLAGTEPGKKRALNVWLLA